MSRGDLLEVAYDGVDVLGGGEVEEDEHHVGVPAVGQDHAGAGVALAAGPVVVPVLCFGLSEAK